MKTSTIVVIIAVLVVLLGGIFLLGAPSSMTGNTTGTGSTGGSENNVGNENTDTGSTGVTGETKTITLDAMRFQYSPNAITVKKGDHVKIIVNNKDFNHGIVIPGYSVSGIDSVEFTADKAGTFQFRCPTPCGSGHMGMTGTLIVQE
ncbi:cupredoxin domain-containing protein [Candidatus Pacearchaeota archaeon]|nr:cupredoxin domain-containing protein [Candidatus Pacearchaeota archaeon]